MTVNHVGLRVSDLDRSTRFYEALGFSEVLDMEVPDDAVSRLIMVEPPIGLRAVYLTNDSFVLELLAFSAHAPADRPDRIMTDVGLTHLSIGVDDVAAAKATVAANGGEVIESSDVGAAVMVRDPNAHLHELLDVTYRPVTP